MFRSATIIIIILSADLLKQTAGYRDEGIVQRRPTIRTENDNFVLETPRNRNITLNPGPGGFVRIGNTIISGDTVNAQPAVPAPSTRRGPVGPQGATGPAGQPGPQGDRGSSDTAASLIAKLAGAGIDLVALAEEVRALREEVTSLKTYSLRGTFPAIFEFFNNKYGERFSSPKSFGRSGLLTMTEAGGVHFGQHIQATGLSSGTTYAITFYLKSNIAQTINIPVAGSDETDLYIDDSLEIKCGDGNASFNNCPVPIPARQFKLTLVCNDSQDVLESIGFQPKWITINQLEIDWESLNRVWKKSTTRR